MATHSPAQVLEATVLAHEEVAPEHFVLRIAAPGIARAAQPGQFVMVRSFGGWDPLLPRAYSVFQANAEEGWVSILYRVTGRGTTRLRMNHAGEHVHLWGPLGNRFDRSPVDRTLLVGGGVGVPPLAFLAGALSCGGEGEVVALIGASTARFLAGLDAFRAAGARLRVATDDGTDGHHGYVTDLLREELTPGCRVQACGPMPMLAAVERTCRGSGAAVELALEAPMACGIGACLGCTVPRAEGGYARVCTDGPVFPAGVIEW